MTQLGTQPRLGRYARNAAESANPELWRSLLGAWVPVLGVQGTQLFDVSGYGSHGTLTNMVPQDDWIVGELGLALDFNDTGGPNEHIPITLNNIPTTNRFTMVTVVSFNATSSYDGMMVGRVAGGNFGLIVSGRETGGPKVTYTWEDTSDEYNWDNNLMVTLGTPYIFAAAIEPTQSILYLGDIRTQNIVSQSNIKTHNVKNVSGTWNLGWNELFAVWQFDGHMWASYLFNSTLQERHIELLMKDFKAPFRLREQGPMFVAASGGGGATSFIPYKNYMKPLLVR